MQADRLNAGIQYTLQDRPGDGEILDVAEGVKWLRLPLPFQLNHINLWLLRDDGGWTLVDTGLSTAITKTMWENILENHLDGLLLKRVVVTHLHPDHSGCAGWLARRFGIRLWMTREEYLLCRVLIEDTGKPAPPEAVDFYRAAGFSTDMLELYAEHFGGFGRVVSPLPATYRRIRDGMTIPIGGDDWQVIVGRGHSPEHACLFCPERGLLISGDQVLPTISSNISVYPTEPEANPLRDWFDSLDKLAAALPRDVRVLPAHGRPFTGVHARLQELRDEHEQGLDKLRELCRTPRRAVDVFPALFRGAVNDRNRIMATGEAIAHLNYLLAAGELRRDTDAQGVHRYSLLD